MQQNVNVKSGVQQRLRHCARRGAPNPLLFCGRCARNSNGFGLSGMHGNVS